VRVEKRVFVRGGIYELRKGEGPNFNIRGKKNNRGQMRGGTVQGVA